MIFIIKKYKINYQIIKKIRQIDPYLFKVNDFVIKSKKAKFTSKYKFIYARPRGEVRQKIS